MSTFKKVDPNANPPAFEQHAVVEVKYRDGRVRTADKPWELEGWNHREWLPTEFRGNEIVEYREI